MKCPNCDGSGIVNEPIYNKSHTLIKNWAIKKCDMCNGSGEYIGEPQTNEEYLKSLDTEQLAEYLAYNFDLCGAGCHHCFLAKTCLTKAKNGNPLTQEQMIVEWLKQPHTEKE